MNMKPKILIIEDDAGLARSHKDNISDLYDVELSHDPESGLLAAKKFRPSLVVLDLGFPSDVEVGLSLIPKLLETDPRIKIIVTTGFGCMEVGAKSIGLGAYNYIEKPIRDYHGFLIIIEQALKIQAMEEEVLKLRSRIQKENTFYGLIGVSSAMKDVFESIKKVAPSSANVLIEGETGTGKELVARAIHMTSPRAAQPFVVVNCTAIPETMLEDKLFGHEKGAFTSAISKYTGALEIAHQGTVFLDEIGEIEPETQVKLLRFIQHKNFQRLGANKDINVDVRIIAATNKDLASEMRHGRFREDLYYRLNVYPITVPPLKNHKEDIPLLASHFLQKYSEQFGKKVTNIHAAATTLLMDHEWPGNVRELENLIQRAILSTERDEIGPDHLNGISREATLSKLEALHQKYHELWIREAYARNSGDIEKACRELGISKRQMQRYNKKYSIERKAYKI